MSRLSQTVCLVASITIVFGCARREVSKVDPASASVGRTEVAVEPNRDLDILFVIDNSSSMRQEQESLVANFPKFIEVLEKIDGGLPNVHIGVISTDVGAGPEGSNICPEGGDNGLLQFAARPPPLSEGEDCPNNNAPDPGCTGLPSGETFLQDLLSEDGESRTRNYNPGNMSTDPDPLLADNFSCIAQLGRCGCGFEQPLESMRRALDPQTNINPGFIRDTAFLAVIIISDEDDCSMGNTAMLNEPFNGTNGPSGSYLCFMHGVKCDPDVLDEDPLVAGQKTNCLPRPGIGSEDPDKSQFLNGVEEYVSFLKSLKNDPGLIIVAEITGGKDPVSAFLTESDTYKLTPQCSSPTAGQAAPAVRLRHFATQFPNRNTTETICQDDLTGALQQIATLLVDVVNNPCVQGNIDTDPVTEGVQHECIVYDVLNAGFDNETATVLPECSSDTPSSSEMPCWYFATNNTCETTTNLELTDVRSSEAAPVGTKMRLECVLAD